MKRKVVKVTGMVRKRLVKFDVSFEICEHIDGVPVFKTKSDTLYIITTWERRPTHLGLVDKITELLKEKAIKKRGKAEINIISATPTDLGLAFELRSSTS